MTLLVNFNGSGYLIPTTGETGWSNVVTSFLSDLGNNSLVRGGALTGSTLTIGGTGPVTGFGTAIGQVPQFINYNASGFAGLHLGSRLILDQTTPAIGDFAVLQLNRTTTFTGGSGQFSNILRAIGVVGANDASQNWGIVSTMTTSGTAGGGTVGGFFQSNRSAGSTQFIWGSISDAVDNTGLGTLASGVSGTAASEQDLEANGLDDGVNAASFGGKGVRKIVNISAVRRNISITSPPTQVSNGLWFTTTTGGGVNTGPDAFTHYQSAIGFGLNTQTQSALDTRGAIPPAGSSNPVNALTMSAGHVLDFNGGTALTSVPGRYLTYNTGGTKLQYLNAGTELFSMTDAGTFQLTSSLFVNKSFTITGATVSGPTNYAYGSNVSYSGTPTTPSTYQYHIFSSNDNVQFTAGSNTVNAYSVLRLNTGFTGNRIGLGSSVNVIGVPGAPTPGWVIALWGDITGTANQGGTGLTPGTSNGSIWAGLLNTTLLASATNYALYQGLEIDMNGVGTTMRKHGLQISLGPSDINRGALFDAAFVLGNNTGCAGSWKHGILLSEDSSQWPFASDSILIKALMGQNDNVAPAVALMGIDLLDPTFSSAAFRTNGLSIDGNGNLQIGTGYIQPISTGMAIDMIGAVGITANGAGMIVSGGTGWNGHEVLTDPFGGRYKVSSVAAGVITGLTVYRQPIFPTTTTPANPVTLGARSGASGVPPTININWNTTTANALSIQPTAGGKLGFNGVTPVIKPTGVPITLAGIHGALTSLGLIAP